MVTFALTPEGKERSGEEVLDALKDGPMSGEQLLEATGLQEEELYRRTRIYVDIGLIKRTAED